MNGWQRTMLSIICVALTQPGALRGEDGFGARPLQRLAIILDAEQPLPGLTLTAMRAELQDLLTPAGILPVLYIAEAVVHVGETFDVVTVFLQGCSLVPPGYQSPLPLVPLGWVTKTDGEFLSIIHIDCSLTASHVASAIVWNQAGLSKPLMGRALARILVHELLHYLTNSTGHSGSRLFSKFMDPFTLIEPGIKLEPCDLQSLREAEATKAAEDRSAPEAVERTM